MVDKYRFIRLSAGWMAVGRGLVYASNDLVIHIDPVRQSLYDAPSYRYMQFLPEWTWGAFFVLAGLMMIVPCSRVEKVVCRGYQAGALLAMGSWIFTGVLNLVAFPLGAGWLYAGFFAFLSLITLIKPDESTAARNARGRD